MTAHAQNLEMNAPTRAAVDLPSERVRALADIVLRAWEPFTIEEKVALLALINKSSGPTIDDEAVRAMLARTGNNISAAAKNLGCARRTLQKRMRSLGMPLGRSGRKLK